MCNAEDLRTVRLVQALVISSLVVSLFSVAEAAVSLQPAAGPAGLTWEGHEGFLITQGESISVEVPGPGSVRVVARQNLPPKGSARGGQLQVTVRRGEKRGGPKRIALSGGRSPVRYDETSRFHPGKAAAWRGALKQASWLEFRLLEGAPLGAAIAVVFFPKRAIQPRVVTAAPAPTALEKPALLRWRAGAGAAFSTRGGGVWGPQWRAGFHLPIQGDHALGLSGGWFSLRWDEVQVANVPGPRSSLAVDGYPLLASWGWDPRGVGLSWIVNVGVGAAWFDEQITWAGAQAGAPAGWIPTGRAAAGIRWRAPGPFGAVTLTASRWFFGGEDAFLSRPLAVPEGTCALSYTGSL